MTNEEQTMTNPAPNEDLNEELLEETLESGEVLQTSEVTLDSIAETVKRLRGRSSSRQTIHPKALDLILELSEILRAQSSTIEALESRVSTLESVPAPVEVPKTPARTKSKPTTPPSA